MGRKFKKILKKIAIIGANSILAQAIYNKLSINNDVLQVYNTRIDRIKNQNNIELISDFLSKKEKFHTIYFLSSVIDFNESKESIQNIFETNVTLLAQISENFPESKIIHASSVSVYKNSQNEITENSELNPQSSYSISKIWAEKITNNHLGGGINIRISSLFGENMNPTTFLPKVIKSAITTKEIVIFGDGSRKQNYISETEAAEYFCAALDYKENGTFLAVNSKSYSNLEVAQLIQQKVKGTTLKFTGIDESPSFIYNNNQTKTELKITEEYSFSNSLSTLIEWTQKQF